MAPLVKWFFAGGHAVDLSRLVALFGDISSQMLLITVLFLLVNQTQITNVDASTTTAAANDNTTMPAIPCLESGVVMMTTDIIDCKNNGTCVIVNDVQKCQCLNSYFTGVDCGSVNLKMLQNDVFETGISFFWPTEIYLDNYYGIFTRTPLSINSIITPFSIPTGFTKTVTITGLEPDAKEYIMCVVHKDQLGNFTIEQKVNTSNVIEDDLMKSTYLNCGIILTPYDVYGPYTIAAWGIAGSIAGCLLMIMLCRAGCNCRDRPKREKMIAEVMGNFDFLRKSSSKRDKDVKPKQEV